ncbi:DUF4190 domain-containing protein [Streptomyces sp. NPDC048428]|uniref:DUF4190 domain-containing protein n=1 Tax=Streptomyces sp. NPDC048428 TaxID=3154503 RepID=UPI0034465315
MTLTAFTRRSEAAARPPVGDTSAPAAPPSPAVPVKRPTRDADGLAVASFVLGLVGLLVLNLVLGPMAIVMAIVALARSTTRRGRALLGLALGVADLVILAFVVTGNGVVAWSFGG